MLPGFVQVYSDLRVYADPGGGPEDAGEEHARDSVQFGEVCSHGAGFGRVQHSGEVGGAFGAQVGPEGPRGFRLDVPVDEDQAFERLVFLWMRRLRAGWRAC